MRVSNGLGPDQDLHSVGPDLGPKCLQRLSADNKSHHYCSKEIVKQLKTMSDILAIKGNRSTCATTLKVEKL